MSSLKLNYLSYENFLRLLFEILEEQFNYDPNDPLPDYRRENPAELHKILNLIQNNDYYSTFFEKAAYLFVSIIESHIYSNGNKRLAFVSLIYFLMINGYDLKQDKPGQLRKLAIFIADKEQNQEMKFEQMKQLVANYLKEHTKEIKT